ncbi:MAG: beta-ketoacyl-ACP synthase II [Bacteroidales bacterium]|nr:beta-ketoacyl-ACP synthase II [Bacteroidales bacterium]
MKRRVVVTGLGIISCIGNDVDSFWRNLRDGVCGIDYISEFPTDLLEVKIGGKVKDFDPESYGIPRQFIRKQDPFTIYAMAAAIQAMSDSGLDTESNIDPFRLSTYIASGIGGFETITREEISMFEDPSGRWISPNFIPTMIGNMAGGQVAIRFGAKGSCLDIVSACSSSNHAMGEAYRNILHGYADAAITGGTEAATIPIGLASFANCKALSTLPDPKYSSLPFNLNRSGFVMADGAAVLILEELEHAKARGAHIYAEMVGYGSTCDAFHATAPRKDGTTQSVCIKDALDQAGFDPASDCLYINAHGTGTKLNDSSETMACKLALGDYAYKCHISSTKSMHGHMLGATGAAEAIASVLALGNGIVPPTINLDTPDPECDLDYTPNKMAKADLTLAINNSFGFGGHNACTAFRKY